MGFWDTVKEIGSGAVSALTGGAVNLAGNVAADELIGDPNSAEAYRRQKDFYKQRYQWMMKDMRKAGLNPILAAGSAGFSTSGTPAVAMSTLPQMDYSSSAKNVAEMGLIEEKAKTEQVEQLKKMAEVRSELANKYKIRAEAGLITEQERKIWFEITRLHAETIRHMKEGFRTDAEKELTRKQMAKLAVELQRLKNVDRIYSSPASMALSIVREIANSLGLNIGIVAPMRGK